MHIAKGLLGDLPDAGRLIENQHAAAAAAEHYVALVGAPLPDGVIEIARHVHVVILHGADAEKEVERQGVKMRDGDDVLGQLLRFLARKRAWRGIHAAQNARVGIGLESDEAAGVGDHLLPRKRLQSFVLGKIVGPFEGA